jgi:hypothetical protein
MDLCYVIDAFTDLGLIVTAVPISDVVLKQVRVRLCNQNRVNHIILLSLPSLILPVTCNECLVKLESLWNGVYLDERLNIAKQEPSEHTDTCD